MYPVMASFDSKPCFMMERSAACKYTITFIYNTGNNNNDKDNDNDNDNNKTTPATENQQNN